MSDLRSDDGYLRVTWKPIAGRPATVSDLIAALQSEGVGEVRSWCDVHNLTANGTRCRDFTISPHDCHIVPVLVVRIDGEA